MDNEQTEKLLVVVVNWNGGENTLECIDSLRRQTFRTFDLVVVDNGSSESELRILDGRFGGTIRIMRLGENLGFPEACNRGFALAAEARYTYLMTVNNDTRLDREVMGALLAVADRDESIGAVVPKIYYWHRPNTIQYAGGDCSLALGMTIHRGINTEDTGNFDEECDIGFAEASACLYRVSAIERVGFFDAAFFAYWEDADLSMRLLQAHYRLVYCPTAKVWHKVSSSAPPHTKTFLFIRNAITFARRYCGNLQLISSLISIMAVQGPILVVQSVSRSSSWHEKREVLVAPFLALLWHVNRALVEERFWRPESSRSIE